MSGGSDSAPWIDAGPPDPRLQRALRFGGAFAFTALIALGPVFLFTGRRESTLASVPPPAWSFEAFRTGAYPRGLERWAKESSPITYWLRGRYNEARFELGVLHVDRVIPGRDGWLFVDESLTADGPLLAARRERRLQFLRLVKNMAAARGAHLLVVPAPDKPTIHPEYLPEGLELSAARLGLYDSILADLREAEVPHLDLRAVLLREKAARPDTPLYYARDTHWTGPTVRLVASAIAEEVRARGWAAELGPRATFVDHGMTAALDVPDLVRMLGMRTNVPRGEPAAAATVRRLQHETHVERMELPRADGAAAEYAREQPSAPVALCGTSYSEACLRFALPRALGVLVDQRGVVAGGGPFSGIGLLGVAMAAGELRPKLIVWEFVERDWTLGWLEPPGN